MIICQNCGYQNSDDARFCVLCGVPLRHVAPSTPSESHSKRPRAVVATVIVVAAIAVVAFLGWRFVLGSGQDAPTILATEGPEQSDDVSGQTDGAVAVRDSLADYSWDEIAQIASAMEAAQDRDGAMQIAKDYHLVDSSGTFTTDTKAVQLTDGTSLNMMLVGVWHDDLASGSGKAGLSFLSTNVAGRTRVAGGTTTDGGWAASELRSYLANDVYQRLPSDLRGHIVSVEKLTNNVGKTSSTADVTTTADQLWAPSIRELVGAITWTYDSNPTASSAYNDVLNAEGEQYERFAQVGIRQEESNVALAFGDTWWMRSSGPSTGRGRYVGTNGDPSLFGNSNDERGVVVGFCL